MNFLNSLRISHRFAMLIAVFTVGFAAYGGWSFKTLNELKVNGPMYQHIVQDEWQRLMGLGPMTCYGHADG